MSTRTRNLLWLLVFSAVAAALLVLTWRSRRRPDLTPRALDAIPRGALVVVEANVSELRLSPAGRTLVGRVRERRVIEGLGSVRQVCGFDPLDEIDEIALAVPAAGRDGDFGIVAVGRIDAEALVACAVKVTEAKGGRAVVTPVGGFRTVREADLEASGEIAVKPGMVLLGGGAYLRAMMDAAEARMPTIRSSDAHRDLSRAVGPATLRATVVLTPELVAALGKELSAAGAEGAPMSRVVAGALGVRVGDAVAMHAVLACRAPEDGPGLAGALRAARDEQAADVAVRLLGVGQVLSRVTVEDEGALVHGRVELPADQAITIVDRVLTLGSMRHPMPTDSATAR